MRRLIIIVSLLCLPAWGAIARDGNCPSTSGTSCTFSATATASAKIMFAYRSGSTTAPTCPAGWTCPTTWTGSGTTSSYRAGCNKSTSSGDTGSGTWTNATLVTGDSYSGTDIQNLADCNFSAFGTFIKTNGTGTTATYGALKLTDSTSWATGFLGSSAGSPCTPSGMTSISTTGAGPSIINNDTNATASSWPSTNCTITSGNWITFVVQVNAAVTTGTPALIQGRRLVNLGNVGSPLTGGQNIKIAFPHTTGAGNALIVLWMGQRSGGGADPGVFTITDDHSNSYLQSVDFTGVKCNANGNYIYAAVAPNAASGTSVITFSPANTLIYFTMAILEVSGISTASPIDGIGCTAGGSGTAVTSAAFTPSRTGDYIVHYVWNELDAAPGAVTKGTVTNWASDLKSVDSIDGSIVQDGIYSSTSSFAAAVTETTNTTWDSLAMALKPASAGTVDPNLSNQIYFAHHETWQHGNATSYPLQIPVKGTLVVDQFGGGGDMHATSWVSSPSNTWVNPAGTCTDAGTNNFVQGWYTANPSLTSGAMTITPTQTSTVSDANHIIYDIKNPGAFDAAACTTIQITGNSTFNSITSATLGSADGIFFCDVIVSFNTIIATTTSSAYLQNTFISTHPSGNTTIDEDNGWFTLPVSSTTAKTCSWTPNTDFANTDWTASEWMHFKAPSAGIPTHQLMLLGVGQ